MGALRENQVHLLPYCVSSYSDIFQTKFVEKFGTHFMFSKVFFFAENRTFYEIMWKNVVHQTGHR